MSGNRGNVVRAASLFCALAITATACNNFARHGAQPEKSTDTSHSFGSGVKPIPDISFAPIDKTKKTGILRMQVTDDHNRALPGAIVRYKGPQKGQATTDSHGMIRVSLKPGNYEVDLAPCGTTVITKSQQTASATVVAGTQTQLGILNDIKFERRYRPADSARISKPPPWMIGQVIDVGIRVEDGCNFQAAPNRALPTFGWRLSSNFAFVKSPVYRTDSAGYAPARVKCTKAGNGSIVLFDRSSPQNSADVLLAASGPSGGHSWCE